MTCQTCRLPIIVLSILAVLAGPAIATAGREEDRILQQGNEAFSRANYDEAIASYEKLIDKAGYSASVLYNLANSYALAGKTGLAVLNYERALRLAPGDSDISGNLELLQKEKGLFAGEESATDRFFRLLQPDQWTLLILAAMVIFTAFRLAALKFSFAGRTSWTVAILCLLFFAAGLAGTLFHSRHFNPAVVVAPNGRLLVSPFPSATPVGAVQEGRLVYSDARHGEFVHVTDETRRKGWIALSAIAYVAEGPSQEKSGK